MASDDLSLMQAMLSAEAVGACSSGAGADEHKQLGEWLRELRTARIDLERLKAENRQLRIERDNAREMDDVHGDNWEAATAEIERVRGERDAAVARVEMVECLLRGLLDQLDLRDTDGRSSGVFVRSLGQLRKIEGDARAALDTAHA